MTNWNQVGFDHYRSAPNGGIIWISPDDDRPEGYSIILNKDGETKELGFAEDLRDAKDIADRECRAMESVVVAEKGDLVKPKNENEGRSVTGTIPWPWPDLLDTEDEIDAKTQALENMLCEIETTYGSEDISEAVSMIACAVNGNVKPLAQTIANLKTAIKDAEEENTGDDWEDSTISGRFKQLDESIKIGKTAAKEAVEKAGHAGVDTEFWQRYISKDEPDDIDDISRACSLMLKDPKIIEDACKQVLRELKGEMPTKKE